MSRHHLQHRALSAVSEATTTGPTRGDRDKILTPIQPSSGNRSADGSIGPGGDASTMRGGGGAVHPYSAPILSGVGSSTRSNQGGRSAIGGHNSLATSHLMSMEPVSSRKQLPELGPQASSATTTTTATTTVGSDARSLAIENQRLVARLQEAELSIKHYRSQLRSTSDARCVSVSTQTSGIATQQRSFMDEESDKRIDQLTKTNARLQRQIEELNARSSSNAVPTASTGSDVEINALREQLDAALASQRTVDKKYSTLNSKVSNKDKLLRSKINAAQARAQALRSDVNSIKDASMHLKNMINSTCTDAVKTIEQVVSRFVDSTTNKEAQSANLRNSNNYIDGCTSPMPSGPISPKKRRESPSLDTNLAMASTTNSNTAQSADVRDRINKTIKDLIAAHSSELNATKHSAHVKDLSRLATIRQVTLERDRALSELSHHKQVCDVLLFSVNALEKNISESQPEVAAKLSTSRKRKIDALKVTLTTQSRDLDQRSSEIGALSTVHLKGFEEKAQTKLKQCEEDSSRLLRQLTTEIEECFS